MALMIQGQCIQDPLKAKLLADAQFPILYTSGSVNSPPSFASLTTSSINISTGVYTFSLKNQVGATIATNFSTTYNPCLDAESDIPFTVPSMLFGITLFIVFIITFGFGLTR